MVYTSIMTTFSDFGLDPAILKSLEHLQYKEPSAIQAQSIPAILEGRDLIALAKTGSGKTAACAIPICSRVDLSKGIIQALIIVPTRELSLQYATEVQKIGKQRGVKAFAICGGESASMQLSKLRNGVQVLVATPGRLIDFIYSRQIDLTQVNTLVLDEADEMLSMGFYDDLVFIMQCLVQKHQTLLFSATMPTQIKNIAKQHMKDPHEIKLTTTEVSPDTIDHKFVYCNHEQKGHLLGRLIDEMKPQQALVFCRSRDEVERVCRRLKELFPAVDYLHAGLSQGLRSVITGKFRSAKIRILVATDVAARGLDFSGISHVFIFHLADDSDIYLHRSGRTGRNEKQGTVVTLVTSRELKSLDNVLKVLRKNVSWLGDPPPPPPPSHSHKPEQGKKRPGGGGPRKFFRRKPKPKPN